MITLTPYAAEKVKEIATAEDLDGYGIRYRLVGGGCAGFSNDLFFENEITELDERFESHGVIIYVDPISLQYVEDTVIDYVDSHMGGGFKFINPNSKGSCGCGSSISF
jgi:iron-sulfur cluster insertion protein